MDPTQMINKQIITMITLMSHKTNKRIQHQWSSLIQDHNAVEIAVVLFLNVFNVKLATTILNVTFACLDLVRIGEIPSAKLIEHFL